MMRNGHHALATQGERPRSNAGRADRRPRLPHATPRQVPLVTGLPGPAIIEMPVNAIGVLRKEYRRETDSQIVHDSRHARGFTRSYLVRSEGDPRAATALGPPVAGMFPSARILHGLLVPDAVPPGQSTS